MKILFLCEYFYPFAHGGAENSTYFLSIDLIKKAHQVFVLTPNYGNSKANQLWKKIAIIRVPFFPKLAHSQALSPIYFYNPFSQLLFFLYSFWITINSKIDVIHVQGSYLILPSFLVAKLLGKKLLVTLRNYQPLCPLSLCITRERNYHACSLGYFFTREINEYFALYEKNSSSTKKRLLTLSLLLARLKSQIDRWLCTKLTNILTISNQEQLILKHNGINSTRVYNSYFPSPIPVRKIHREDFLYIGRLTPGKGIDLLLEAYIKYIWKYPASHRLLIIGQGLLKEELLITVKKNKLSSQVVFLGQLAFTQTIARLSSALAVIVPSVWEEPFGRVALEAQMNQIPTIVTRRGGLPEIVLANKTGLVVEPTVNSLASALAKIADRNSSFRENLRSLKSYFHQKFVNDPLTDHLNLYRQV